MNQKTLRLDVTDTDNRLPKVPCLSGSSGFARRMRSVLLGLAVLVIAGCHEKEKIVQDEAKLAGKSTADFPQITADIFKPMDGGIELTPEEIMGRNTCNLWSGGNEHFWNHAAQDSFGL